MDRGSGYHDLAGATLFMILYGNTAWYSIAISLFDSLSTTQQIIIFVLLLSTAKPLRNSLSYLAGLMGAYCACGVAGYLTLDTLRPLLSKLFPSSAGLSNLSYYRSEFIMGVIMAAIGVWYFYRKHPAEKSRLENGILEKLRTMTSLFAFCAGVVVSVTSFPMSLPYLAALGMYSVLHLKLSVAAGYILLYNIGYSLPMLLVLCIYLIARSGSEDDSAMLHEKAKKLNLHLTSWTFAGLGLFSMADAGCYFTIGRAIIKGRLF